MSDANVLLALDRNMLYDRATLKDLMLYGRVRSLIKRPSILGPTILDGNGYYALLDAYAIKCIKEDYFQEDSSKDINGLYFTKGSVVIYIDSSRWVGKDVKVAGKRMSWGLNLRRQDNKDKTAGITAFVFESNPEKRGTKMYYTLACNSLQELGTTSPDCKGTALEDLMVRIQKSSNDMIPYNESLEGLVPFTALREYEVLDVSADEAKRFDSEDGKIDISSIDMNLTYHLEGKPTSELYYPFKEDLEDNQYKRSVYVDKLLSQIQNLQKANDRLGVVSDIKRRFITNIAANYTKKVYATVKCSDYVTAFINGCSDSNCWKSQEDKEKGDNAQRQKGIDLLRSQVSVDSTVLYGNTNTEIDSIDALNDDFIFATIVIGTCTGIGIDALSNNYSYFRKHNNMSLDSWFYSLLNIPYFLALSGVSLKTADADVIYYSFRKQYCTDHESDDLCKELRRKLVFLDTLSKKAETDTFVEIWRFKSSEATYSQSGALTKNSFPASVANKSVLELLLGRRSLSLDRAELMEIKQQKWYSPKIQKELQDIGLVNTLNDQYIALERELEEEMMIYETFEQLGKMETGIKERSLQPIIDSFEESRGFKLESLQKEAIKLCMHRAGVLSGCAGSGKTTTSDCMTEVLKTLPGYKIVYCAPTGKAARRLSEVVHQPVKTIHSQFGVGLSGTSYMQNVSKSWKAGKDGKHIYILDEMAMCSTSLMYELARNISDQDMVYFLGDIKQLPPVGKGCPFKTLMEFLPCVELGVSKRAAEGSLVNYNTSLINFVSDGVVKELSYDNETFIAKDCSDTVISHVVTNTFKDFMAGKYNGTKFEEDDIQVITGYQKEEIDFSVSRLNEPLQDFLRQNDTVEFVHAKGLKSRQFYRNDRVIHLSENCYDRCRYVEVGVNQFAKLPTFGVVNGEMGKLLGVVRSDMATFYDIDLGACVPEEGFYSEVSEEEMKAILERYEQKKDNLRDDSKINDSRFFFVKVKVYDSDLRKDVIILYRAKGSQTTDGLSLQGSDLANLDLAYALTCHKMQGSQAKVVILPFGTKGSPQFINRNMINTMITRSQGYVCCVGSVIGEDSLINQGRRYVSKCTSHDLLNIMADNIWY